MDEISDKNLAFKLNVELLEFQLKIKLQLTVALLNWIGSNGDCENSEGDHNEGLHL